MAAVRNRNTKPEILVRKLLHALGRRFRLHVRSLPGTPDIVMPRHRLVVQVHGCFWHGHTCRRGKRPVTRRTFWNEKIEKNISRDAISASQLRELGWRVEIVWECELREPEELLKRARKWFSD